MSDNYPWIIWELSSENYQWELSSENYPWELSSENYQWELSSENYHLVYHHAEKLRFIGILTYPKIVEWLYIFSSPINYKSEFYRGQK
jgi:hypothetical protein